MAVDRDDPLAVRLQLALVGTRLVIETVDEGIGGEVKEVLPTHHVLREKHQVITSIHHTGPSSIASIPTGDICFDSENRLDALLPGVIMELDGGMKIAVIGDRHRIHSESGDLIDETWHGVATIQQGILRVQMEMHESMGVLPADGHPASSDHESVLTSSDGTLGSPFDDEILGE